MISKRKTLLCPTFFSHWLLYFWQVPSLQKMWVYINSKLMVTLIQLIWWSRLFFCVFFLLLLSNVCNYLFLGLGGERIRRKYSAKISHVVFSCPSCLVTSPSTHPPTHPPTNPSNLHWPRAMNQVLYWALDLGWNKLGSPAHKGDQKIGILQWKNVKIGHFYHRRILQPGWGDFRESFQDEVLCQLTHDRWS